MTRPRNLDAKTALAEGVLLYASCSAIHYGRVIRVGKDDNGADVLDIEVFDVNEAVHFDTGKQVEKDFPNVHLSRVELPEGVHMILRDVGYRFLHESIIVNTPVGGCFRCTQMFTIDPADTEIWK